MDDALARRDVDALRRLLAALQSHCAARVRCIDCGALTHRVASCPQQAAHGDGDNVSSFWNEAIWSCCTEWGSTAALRLLLAARAACAEKREEDLWMALSLLRNDSDESTETLLSAALRRQLWDITHAVADAICSATGADKTMALESTHVSFCDAFGPRAMAMALQARAPDAALATLFRMAEWAGLAPQLLQGSSSDPSRPSSVAAAAACGAAG